MHRRRCALAPISAGLLTALARPAFSQAADTSSSTAPRREAPAICAAACLANWQDRLSDPSRAPTMSTLIKEEFEQYRLAAIGYYEKNRKASKDEADRNIDGHVKPILAQFIAMDKTGTPEACIDKCPQPEERN